MSFPERDGQSRNKTKKMAMLKSIGTILIIQGEVKRWDFEQKYK